MGFTRKTLFDIDTSGIAVDGRAEHIAAERTVKSIVTQMQVWEDRFGELINEVGQMSADIPEDTKVMTEAGEKTISDLLRGVTSATADGSPRYWSSLGDSPTLDSGNAYGAVAVTPDGRYWIGVRSTGGAPSGELHIYKIGTDDLVDSGVVGTISSNRLKSPTAGNIVVDATGNRVAVICANSDSSDNKFLLIIDISNKAAPAIKGSLLLTGVSTLPATGVEPVWDGSRETIYWPVGDATAHVYSFDVSQFLPTLASTYTTSSLTTCNSVRLSESEDFIYIAGNAGIESAAIDGDGALTRDTTVSTGNLATMAHNNTTIVAILRSSNTVLNFYTVNISSTDEGAISLNTSGTMTGSYTNTGAFVNLSFIGNYAAGATVISGGSAGLFLVFDCTDLTAVTEESSVAISTPDSSFVLAPGGPVSRRYIQLGLNADVETWSVTQRNDGVKLCVDQFCSDTFDGIPFVANSTKLCKLFNADLLDGLHAGELLFDSGDLPAPTLASGDLFVTHDISTGLTSTATLSAIEAFFDHGNLLGLSDDDHTQYSLVTGARAFSGTVSISGGLRIQAGSKLSFDYDGDEDTYIHEVSGNVLEVFTGASLALTIDASQHVHLEATKRLYFDSGSNTYLHEVSADVLQIVSGGTDYASFGTCAIFGTGYSSSAVIADYTDDAIEVTGTNEGGVLRLSRADTTVLDNNRIGMIEAWINDAQTTTNQIAAQIEVQADGNQTTAYARGKIVLRVGGSSGLLDAMTIWKTSGVTLAAPTGSDKGLGTLNAVGVYDDNTLLTDWVFDLAYDGRSDHEIPKGGRLYSLAETTAASRAERRLPWMPTRERFEDERSLGGMVTRLWFGQEQQQLYIQELEGRITQLEAPDD